MAEKLTVFIPGTVRDLPTERERAAETLKRLDWAAKAAKAWLALAQDWAVKTKLRVRATAALGRLGQATPEVLAGLRVLAEPRRPKKVRRSAKEALGVASKVNEHSTFEGSGTLTRAGGGDRPPRSGRILPLGP